MSSEAEDTQMFSRVTEKSKPVAVKRIQRAGYLLDKIIKEAKLMLNIDDHANIIRYYCSEIDPDFVFIATELCAGTLQDLVVGTYAGPPVGDEREILLQITQGLDYLHENKIVHRDIKPVNILISKPCVSGMKPLMKIADFGISRILGTHPNKFHKTTENPSGTKGWMAPEFNSENCDKKIDIFALGCVFGYTLSQGGKHPFGDDPNMRSVRINKKGPMLLRREQLKPPYSHDQVAIELIERMVHMEPNDRPTIRTVLDDVFFLLLSI